MAIKFDPKELDEQYNFDKESIARNWFFVGAELKKIKRRFSSTKLFGRHIAKTDFAGVANHDRSVAIWMFENWREVFNWLEATTGEPPAEPFRQLADLNASHPARFMHDGALRERDWAGFGGDAASAHAAGRARLCGAAGAV